MRQQPIVIIRTVCAYIEQTDCLSGFPAKRTVKQYIPWIWGYDVVARPKRIDAMLDTALLFR